MEEKKSRIKDFLFRFKIFMWYIITEPFRQIYNFIYHISQALDKTKSWVYIVIIIIAIALFLGRRPVAGYMLLILMLMILLWEWTNGTYMYRYRQVQKKKIKKTLEEKESKILKEDNGGK